MDSRNEIHDRLEKKYIQFFKDNYLDETSGLTNRGKGDKRFATYAYIGSKYGEVNPKILFIGLDIGKDELSKENRFQNFEDRRIKIEKEEILKHNAHISGTLLLVATLLNKLPFTIEKDKNYKEIIEENKKLLEDNLLSYISLINLRKFVDKDKNNRKQMKFFKKELEERMLLDEIKELKPDIIIFQGICFRKIELARKLSKDYACFFGYHPSFRLNRTFKRLLESYGLELNKVFIGGKR